MWNQLKILAHKEVIESILNKDTTPIHVEIELTEICNHACIFCHWHGDPRKNKFSEFDFTGNRSLPIERALTLIDELEMAGTKAISFTGVGDPLMYPKIELILKKILNTKMEFAVTSNMNMNLSNNLIKLLKKAKWIRVSLDAGSDLCYKKVHNPKSNKGFSDTIENIKKLVSEDGQAKINVSFVICDQNKKEISLATKKMRDIGVNSISFRPDTGFERTNEDKEYDSKIKEEITNAKKFEDGSFKVYANYERLHETKKQTEKIFCYYSNYSVYISSNGDVYPCCMTRYNKRYVIDNILNKKFNDFWNSKSRKENYKKINMEFCPPCRHTYDNIILKSMYGDVDKIDNFI